jgi:hypothetical protein
LTIPLRSGSGGTDAEDATHRLPRMPWRRRLLILLLAVATALTIVLTLLSPPGGVKRVRRLPDEPARCLPGQSSDCVGGTARVIPPSPGH